MNINESKFSAAPPVGQYYSGANKLYGIPQRKRWRKKVCGQRPENVRNHLQRDFTASEPTLGG